MKLEIHDLDGLLSDTAFAIAEAKASAAFSKFSHQIHRIVVTVTNSGGTRGEQEKECRLTIKLPRVRDLMTVVKDVSLSRAISKTIRLSERGVVKRLEKRSTFDRSRSVRLAGEP